MGQVAERLVAKAGSVIATQDVEAALQLERDDDEMDRLHRALFTELLDESAPYGIEAAIDVTLSAATTSGSPTTRSPWRAGSSTWSPASSPSELAESV